MHDPYKALYVHIPFCVKRCAYCDFTTHAVAFDDPSIDDYIDDLCMQIRRKAKEGELADLSTIYLGGGTPSYIGNARLTKLLYLISVSVRLENISEFSMEANPESITEALIKDSWAMGVNRLSIGVQSFDDNILSMLGRAHSAQTAKDALALAHQRFENVSVDLMCGIPGQTQDSLVLSLEEAIDAGVSHISIYPLTIEPFTPLDSRMLAGEFPEIDEDMQAAHMELAEKVLTAHGFVRYEVANYALPGHESMHNKAYWTGLPYLGIGLSAATMTQNSERRMRVKDGLVTDDLNKAQMLAEDLMLGMRLAQGISTDQVERACVSLPGLHNELSELIALGLVEFHENRYKPTRLGWLCGNELYGRIYDLAP